MNDESNVASMANIIKAFTYWPRVMRLMWNTKGSCLIAIIFLNIFRGISPIIILLLTQNLLNRLAYSLSSGFQTILSAFIAFVGFSILSELIGLVQNYIEEIFRDLLVNNINVMIMEKSVSLSLKDFENPSVQDALNIAQNEASSRPYQIMQQIMAFISGIVSLISAAGLLIAFKPWMAVLLLVMPLTSFYSYLRIGQQEFLIRCKRAPKLRKVWYYAFLMTNDKNFKEIKIYEIGKYILKHYHDLFMGFYKENRSISKKRLILGIFFQILDQAANIFMMLMVIQAAFAGQILIGNVVGLLQTITLTQTNSQSLVGGVLSICQHNLYLSKFFTFMDLVTVEDTQNRDIEISEIQSIEFQNVSFRYPGCPNYALRNVTFTINQGETIAIVGRNGSGKTTLVKLLTQLYDEFEGEILINGISIRSINVSSLRKQIGVVFQDFVQYELTMRHNIGFGDISKLHDDERLLCAAQNAGIEDLVTHLPEGLDTQIGKFFEKGQQLSGGQWQRVAIARAFLRDSDLYIMDEPSSMLDPESETQVFQQFQKLIEQRIGIFISHRYTAIKYADHILMMDQGFVAEQGSHNELMQKNGLYAYLFNMQLDAYKTV